MTARTNDSGWYSLTLPAPAAYLLEISATDSQERISLASGITVQVTGLQATLRRDFSVAGIGLLVAHVLDPSGRPAPSVSIRAARREVVGWTRIAGTSNEQGVWQAQVAAGDYMIRAFSPSAGLAGTATFCLGEDEKKSVELHLKATLAAVRGNVVDFQSRQGIDQARIELLPEGQRHALPGEYSPVYETDSRGAFALAVEEAGDYTIRVRAAGYLESTIPVRVDQASPHSNLNIMVEMSLGHSVIGGVIDWTGQPVAGAEVHLRASLEGAIQQVTTLSDEGGAFQFEGLRPEPAQIWASHSESISEKTQIEVPADDVLLELGLSGTVEGFVEWEDGRTVEEPFSLLLIREGPASLDNLLPYPGRIQNRRGAFTLKSVEPGRYRIQVNVLPSQEEGSEMMTGRSEVFQVDALGPVQVIVRVTGRRPNVQPLIEK